MEVINLLCPIQVMAVTVREFIDGEKLYTTHGRQDVSERVGSGPVTVEFRGGMAYLRGPGGGDLYLPGRDGSVRYWRPVK